jgi:hypothetical protein
MKIVCSWCGKSMGEKPCDPAMAGQTSHGMCPDCNDKEKRKFQRDKHNRLMNASHRAQMRCYALQARGWRQWNTSDEQKKKDFDHYISLSISYREMSK